MTRSPALLLLLAGTAFAARNCSTFWVPPPEGRRRLSSASIHYTGTKTTPTLVVASNHKTGTFLSRSTFARDPLVLAESGYRYHRTGPEAWTRVALDGAPPGKQYQGEGAAFARFARRRGLAGGGRVRRSEALGAAPAEPPRRNETYADALGRFSLRDGLLFEALRSLHRDVPYAVGGPPSTAAPRAPTARRCCSTTSWRTCPARSGASRGLPPRGRRSARGAAAAGAVERAFLDACGPESTFVASKKDGSATARDAGSHRNGPDAERAGRLATLRDIDAVYLGGRLAAANATLRRHLR
ncbi:hypothetical protein SO694_0006707 [Aureococcus anophagefferens]|uniref:Uncharacterized protein n=1 Tax=Aureococcus anophagefferens TaxID=44056 RepID=A0ABR1FQD4_AURAN